MQEHQQYPRIFHLTMDIIPIQASSVAGLLIWKADNDTSKWMYRSSTDGGIADLKVFNLKGGTVEILRYELGRGTKGV